jgi:hypothetical protein
MRLSEENWQLVYQQTHYQDSAGWRGDPIYIPVLLDSPIIRVACLSETARSTWRVAGELVQVVGDNRNPDFEGEAISLPLNVTKLVEFSPTVGNYSLKLLPKPWIDLFELKIESLLAD